MGSDDIDHLLRHPISAAELGAQHGMRALHLVIHRFADIVEQAAHLGGFEIGLELGSDHRRQLSGLHSVRKLILAIGGAKLEAAQLLDDLLLQAGHTGVEGSPLALLHDQLLDVLPSLVHDLLDVRGMDTAVEHQSLHRPPCHFAAHRIEAGDGDRLGGVVHDHIHAGRFLEGADIASVAPDDPPFHLVRRQRHG